MAHCTAEFCSLILLIGMQMINKEFGGTVDRKEAREDGQFSVELDITSKLFTGLSKSEQVTKF